MKKLLFIGLLGMFVSASAQETPPADIKLTAPATVSLTWAQDTTTCADNVTPYSQCTIVNFQLQQQNNLGAWVNVGQPLHPAARGPYNIKGLGVGFYCFRVVGQITPERFAQSNVRCAEVGANPDSSRPKSATLEFVVPAQ
jgi:hypothetical protein